MSGSMPPRFVGPIRTISRQTGIQTRPVKASNSIPQFPIADIVQYSKRERQQSRQKCCKETARGYSRADILVRPCPFAPVKCGNRVVGFVVVPCLSRQVHLSAAVLGVIIREICSRSELSSRMQRCPQISLKLPNGLIGLRGLSSGGALAEAPRRSFSRLEAVRD